MGKKSGRGFLSKATGGVIGDNSVVNHLSSGNYFNGKAWASNNQAQVQRKGLPNGGTDPNQNNATGQVQQTTGQAIVPYEQGNNAPLAVQPSEPVVQTAQIDPGPKYVIPKNLKEAQQQVLQRQNMIATGRNSISELQFKRAMDDIAKGQNSAAASARGVSNTGLMQRNVMQMGQQAGMDLARESASAKLAEQRGADELIAAQAAAANGVSLQRSLADQAAATAKRGQDMQMVGNVASSAATVYGGGGQASSDENNKTNIKPSDNSSAKVISEFMDALKSYTYEYKKGSKQPGGKPTPEGEVKGVMAQDLEKSEVGKQMVTDTPNGKVVDYAQGMAPLFAAIAELNERTKHLGKGK